MWVWFSLFSVQQCTCGLEPSLISILGWIIGICQLQKLIIITHCRQLRQLLQVVASFNRCSQLWQLLQAVASLDSFFKLLAARPQLHFYINIASMFDSISKGQIIQIPKGHWSVSQLLTDIRGIWSDLGLMKIQEIITQSRNLLFAPYQFIRFSLFHAYWVPLL